MKIEVTERDFRAPEFKDAKAEDYEFDGDGKVVRKDRWQRAIEKIRFYVGVQGRTYEIDHVIGGVFALRYEQASGIDVTGLKEISKQLGKWTPEHGVETKPDDIGLMVNTLVQYVGSLIESGEAIITPLQAALARRSFTMSEPHLSGHRLIIGFEQLPHVQKALELVAFLPQVDPDTHHE